MSETEKTAYRVLARKYRPQTFDDLIGQAPMVQTLTNAFRMGRIAQAYMLTGVRGVGKTTTARILARALNYETRDEDGKMLVDEPTIEMPELGAHCQAIIDSRHVDVIEMDAASHTSINDIREIIEAARYKPATARFKVYIIDEVHMLSTAAFNGLLKTLEEPPPHVKFIFATTEIRKVPVTVLSRCQRFDLRRIESEEMSQYLRSIAGQEGVSISDDALRLLARASEGSARDALSLLDQAIAHGSASAGAEIDESTLREMLGLSNRSAVVDLFEHVMSGRVSEALGELNKQYIAGAEPLIVISDLAEFSHLVTRLKVAPDLVDRGTLSPRELERGHEFAQQLSLRVLSSSWQVLLKGLNEIGQAPRPLPAAEMVVLRLAHAADLPPPDEVLKKLAETAESSVPSSASTSLQTPSVPQGSVRSDSTADEKVTGSHPEISPETSAHRSAGNAALLASRPEVNPSNEAASHLMLVEKNEALAEIDPVSEARSDSSSPLPKNLEDVARLAGEKRAAKLKFAVERHLRPVSFSAGHIEVSLTPDALGGVAGELGRFLSDVTGQRWVVSIVRSEGGPTLYELSNEREARRLAEVRQRPLVEKAFQQFPGVRLIEVVQRRPSDKNNEET